MTIGFRILTRQRRISDASIFPFRSLPVANVSDVMSRMSGGGAALRPMHNGAFMAGPALTVKTRPGDNLMLHKALDIAEPGDVVVVDAGGDLTNALFGEIMSAHAVSRQVAGIVIYGAIRDAAVLAQSNFPVFACGITHRGPFKDGPGEINVPIAFNGMVIEPGDLVIGDADGVLCVPYEDAEAIAVAAKRKADVEAVSLHKARTGTPDRAWVDETLRRLGCTFEGS